MRVLHLCCDPGIGLGRVKGASVHLAELAEAFANEGADVLLTVPTVVPGAAPPRGVTVDILPGGGNAIDGAALERERTAWLVRCLREWRADVLYERLSLLSTCGSLAASATGVPHLVEVNAALPDEAARYRGLEALEEARRLERHVLANAAAVFPVSRPLARYARRRGARRVEVCPNGVAVERFPAADARREPVTAVFAGALRPWHGAAEIADAWQLLGARAPRLMVVGDGEGRDRLEAVGAAVTGRVPHDQVPALLAQAQIGLAAYPADAPIYFSPLKLFEYLAAGLAVIASDLPGIRDVVGDTALLVPAGDPPVLAAAISRLVADPGERARLGSAARVLAQSHTWSMRARQILAVAVSPHQLEAAR
jgi:glycosyltransferase involved in cell wall biosynthesis